MIMKHLEFFPNQVIDLTADETKTTITQALTEAIELSKKYEPILVEFNLHYNGFEMAIEYSSDVDEIKEEYESWLESNSTINTDLPF